jgi:multimeric flavodoxin WrbA
MEPAKAGPRVLIVYFSRSGHVASVARVLATACNGDLERIETTIHRRGLLGYALSGFEATFKREARIHPPDRNPQDYDIVLLGTPTWNMSLSSPMRTYLKRFTGKLPEVGFFVTSKGPTGERVAKQMTDLCGKQPLAVMALAERDFRGRWSVYLSEFWESVLSGWEAKCMRAAQ